MIELTNDVNAFNVMQDGIIKFVVEREHLKDSRRGFWLVKMPTSVGLLIVDRDQYSNDIIERTKMYLTGRAGRAGRPIYGHRFKDPCTKQEFFAHSATMIADLAFEFGGEWCGEYYDWEDCAVYARKVS